MEPERMGSTLQQPRSSVNCTNCGLRWRHRDSEGLREWCARCIDVYYRKQKIRAGDAERIIQTLVGPKYTVADFDNFKGPDIPLRDRLLKLNPDEDVFMHGAVGTGKTYSMAALIREYVNEGYECQRINFDDFCVQVRSTMGPAATITEWDMVEPLKQVDKLFIDDLGLRSKQETDFAYVTLYTILNKRQERMLPTYVCSNKTIDQLAQHFDERIASRLRTAEIIEMTGTDRRKKQQ